MRGSFSSPKTFQFCKQINFSYANINQLYATQLRNFVTQINQNQKENEVTNNTNEKQAEKSNNSKEKTTKTVIIINDQKYSHITKQKENQKEDTMTPILQIVKNRNWHKLSEIINNENSISQLSIDEIFFLIKFYSNSYPSKRMETVYQNFLKTRKPQKKNNRDMTKIFNQMLHYYQKQKDVAKIRSVLNDIKNLGMSPDIATYAIVIEFFCNLGEIEHAEEIFELTDPKTWNIFVFAPFLKYFGRQKNTQKSLELYKIAEENNLDSCGMLLNILLDNFIQTKEFNLIDEIYAGIKHDQKIKKINQPTFNVLLRSAFIRNDFEKINFYANELKLNGFSLDAYACASILQFLYANEQFSFIILTFDQITSSSSSSSSSSFAAVNDPSSSPPGKLSPLYFDPKMLNSVCYNIAIHSAIRLNDSAKVLSIFDCLFFPLSSFFLLPSSFPVPYFVSFFFHSSSLLRFYSPFPRFRSPYLQVLVDAFPAVLLLLVLPFLLFLSLSLAPLSLSSFLASFLSSLLLSTSSFVLSFFVLP